MQRSVPGVRSIILSWLVVMALTTAQAQAQVTTTAVVPTTTDATSSSIAATTTLASPPSDYYRVYAAEGPDGPPKVSLEDGFQGEVVNLDPVAFFMAAVETNGAPTADPMPYKACYALWTGRFGASVDVDNRFGSQTLSVGKPAALCAPTVISPGAVPSPLQREYYKCYEASGHPLTDERMNLADGFQRESDVQVLEPFWFCNPVATNGEGILNPDKHLTCYRTSVSQPAVVPGRVMAQNQFHESEEAIFIFEARALCVPSSMRKCTSDGECSNGNPCTTDSCDATTGVCIHSPTAASCVPDDACMGVGQCVKGECKAMVAGVADLICTLDDLLSVPCVADELPKRLRRVIRKRVKRARRVLLRAEQAANTGKSAKVDKLRGRATKQLEAISKKVDKPRWAACKDTIGGLIEDRQRWIDDLAF